jgi:hypothetical protein
MVRHCRVSVKSAGHRVRPPRQKRRDDPRAPRWRHARTTRTQPDQIRQLAFQAVSDNYGLRRPSSNSGDVGEVEAAALGPLFLVQLAGRPGTAPRSGPTFQDGRSVPGTRPPSRGEGPPVGRLGATSRKTFFVTSPGEVRREVLGGRRPSDREADGSGGGARAGVGANWSSSG